MKTLPTLAVVLSLATLSCASLAAQEESQEDLIRKLKGQAGQTPARGLNTRGLQTRGGISATAVAPEVATRSVLVPAGARGVPQSVQVAVEENKVEAKETATGAVEITYTVDPKSEVSRDNIFFRKGSADFADDASVAVVVTLADALKHPDLKGLKYVVEGHASAEGNDLSNLILSQQRAEAIVSVLASLGVERDRLVPVGFGESKSRFPETSPDALLKQDRRVLIFRLEK